MDARNVRYYYVCNHQGATGLGGGARLTAYDDLNDGEVAVVNAGNIVLNSSNIGSNSEASQNGVRIAFRSGSELYLTPLVKDSNLISYLGRSTSSEQEQITYIGYNGSGNSIDTISNNTYVPRINFWTEGRQEFDTPYIKDTAYSSGDNPTQSDVALGVANGLQVAFNYGVSAGKEKTVKTEVVCSGSNTSLTGSTGDITVTKYSKWITAGSDIDNEMSVGDYFRAGTDTSAPVYKITYMDTSNQYAKLDRPYEGDSNTFDVSEDEAYYVTSSDASSADFGIKLSGIAQNFSDPKKDAYEKVKFTVGLDGWGNTEVTYDQDAQRGIGIYEDVAEAEYLYLGNEGNSYRGDIIYSQSRQDADSSYTYNLLTIAFYNDQLTNSLGYTRSPIEITLALRSGYSAGQSHDVVVDALDTYFGITSGLSA